MYAIKFLQNDLHLTGTKIVFNKDIFISPNLQNIYLQTAEPNTNIS